MIYWFTGQPSHGKTTLGKLLIENFKKNNLSNVFHIDGDDLRFLTKNQDYSKEGRIENVNTAQKIAHYLHNQGNIVIVSLVSPFRWQREEFKNFLKDNVIELYVHTNLIRERENFRVEYYEEPTENFINVDTTFDSPEESLKKIINQIKITNEKLYS